MAYSPPQPPTVPKPVKRNNQSRVKRVAQKANRLSRRPKSGARRNRHGRSRRPIRHELSAGGVVVREEGGQWMVALLKTEHKRGEVWVLPKGHVEPEQGETVSDAARREVEEEAGITSLSVKNQLGVTRFSFQTEDALVHKKVHYFLMSTKQRKLIPQAEEGLIDAAWEPIDQAIERLEYETDQDIVSKARETLTGRRHYPKKRSSSGRKKTFRIHF